MQREHLALVAGRLRDVCDATAPGEWLGALQASCTAAGLDVAVARHDTPALFDWLMRILAFQGISNAIAAAYLDQHGSVGCAEISVALATAPPCPRLTSYWHFHDCRFAKVAGTCAEPMHRDSCPLPSHDLRNGRLNQAAYSLFLFLRDVCDGDLVGWIDQRLAEASAMARAAERSRQLRAAVLEPLLGLYGVSHKVLSLALSDLLLGADPRRPLWIETGASFVVVDTLVHNWLHRTGSLHALDAVHPYGAGCYAPGGCADIIAAAAALIDARRYAPAGPAVFPRLLQKAVWQFAAAEEHDTCNGNRIDDRGPCTNAACPVASCARVPLR